MRLRNYIYISAFLIGLASCDLNEFPQDTISPETFFKTEAELKLYSDQFYLQMPAAEDLYDEASNLSVKGLSLSNLVLGNTRVIPASGGGWSWVQLRHINYFLQNSHRCSDEKARTRYEGVAYFWRAYFYFEKLQRFGDAPWYDQPLASNDTELLTKPRDSRDLIMQHIIEDLDKAAAMLPTTTTAYTVNKYAALALKARACLFEGTFRKYHAGKTFNPESLPYNDLLEEAAKAAYIVMTESKYSLYKSGKNPYRDLFTAEDAITQEVILARCYANNIRHMADAFALIPSKGRAGFTKALMFSYLMADGSRFTDKDGYQTIEFVDEVKNRDPRLAQTVLTQGVVYTDETKGTFSMNNTITGYPILKYVNGPAYTSGGTNDMALFRLGEVYLNYAEAKAEAGGLTQKDLDISINLLRDRVKMPHLSMDEANRAPDQFLMSSEFGYVNVDRGQNCGVILEIRRERSIELVNEGFRYYDLLRWREGRLLTQPFYGPYMPGPGKYDMDGDGKVDMVIYLDKKIVAPGVTSLQIGKDIFLSDGEQGYIIAHGDKERVFDENRDYLYPIPINDRVLTNGNLTQNPGWDDGLTYE